jgi:hypothetical protein
MFAKVFSDSGIILIPPAPLKKKGENYKESLRKSTFRKGGRGDFSFLGVKHCWFMPV